MTIGGQIRRLREQSGRSVQDLASSAGVHLATWYRAEHDDELTIGSLRKIAAAVGCELILRQIG